MNRRSFIFGSAAALGLLAVQKPTILMPRAVAELYGSGDRVLKQITFGAGWGEDNVPISVMLDGDLLYRVDLDRHHMLEWYLHQGLVLRANQHLDVIAEAGESEAFASIVTQSLSDREFRRESFIFNGGKARRV